MADLSSLRGRYEASVGKGSFYPATLLLFLDSTRGHFYMGGDFDSNRILHHEYLHFVQHSTTPYGLNCFLRDLDLIDLTLMAARELAESKSKIHFPLNSDVRHDVPASLRERIDGLRGMRAAIIEDLAILQGAYKFNRETGKCIFRGRPVTSDINCRVVGFEDA